MNPCPPPLVGAITYIMVSIHPFDTAIPMLTTKVGHETRPVSIQKVEVFVFTIFILTPIS